MSQETVLSDVPQSLREFLTTMHDANIKRIDDLETAVFGNGSRDNPGIKLQVDRIYTRVNTVVWLVGVLASHPVYQLITALLGVMNK